VEKGLDSESGLPGALALLHSHLLQGKSSAFDNLIFIHGQYQRYHEDLILYDVLSAEEQRIGYNKNTKGDIGAGK
jgi:hypothetical protein